MVSRSAVCSSVLLEGSWHDASAVINLPCTLFLAHKSVFPPRKMLMKNVTLSADEALIEAARAQAK